MREAKWTKVEMIIFWGCIAFLIAFVVWHSQPQVAFANYRGEISTADYAQSTVEALHTSFDKALEQEGIITKESFVNCTAARGRFWMTYHVLTEEGDYLTFHVFSVEADDLAYLIRSGKDPEDYGYDSQQVSQSIYYLVDGNELRMES